MRSTPLFLATALALTVAGCNTAKPPTTATSLEPEIRKKVDRGIVEPGMTPEMVYLALGKPSEPSSALADATKDGTWVYHDFKGNDRDFIKAGFRRRVVFDPARKSDVIVTEPIDPRLFPNLREHSLHVTFKDGRVSEIKRVERI
jgi:hypothetical protein